MPILPRWTEMHLLYISYVLVVTCSIIPLDYIQTYITEKREYKLFNNDLYEYLFVWVEHFMSFYLSNLAYKV